ncbi:hypothetical protein GCM10011352_09500 [Marinobacterium zhoushanense]|uniref:Roadblock/LAMTOR2 domain-containing protein n=1 Tax=Marinobacterium zhoushanense TaxID=1679163 RepID=A0ABQ1K652_9GAMM|nr:hypothetical protein [Marinobacterium zhoushanense]GGB85735.1 hypothetical protein GCM10011352_09500 [Marinobacterium zhoushanense]
MIELLEAVDELDFIEGCCLMQADQVLSSTFPASRRHHETIAKKAFTYVFTNASKLRSTHDEAHLEIGEKRVSGFKLEGSQILICLSSKQTNVVNVRNNVRELYNGLQQQAQMA